MSSVTPWPGRWTRTGRTSRALRHRPLRPAPFEPFPYDEPPYRVLSTSHAHHTETKRYPDGSIVTIDPLTGEVQRIEGSS